MTNEQSFIEKCYKNKHGKVTLIQMPNLPLAAWVICRLLVLILPTGQPQEIFQVIAFGSLFTWAWLEIFQGDAYIRRILGLTILLLTVYGQIN